MIHFDDFLGLSGRDWSPCRLILFYGRSGSGKSTAIRFVLEEHARNHDPRPHVIDEIRTVGDLLAVRRQLRDAPRTLVATHVHPSWFRLLVPVPTAVFCTDRDGRKIARHLDRMGVSATSAAVDRYVRRYGATYTDAELILERFPSSSFDLSLAQHLKFDRIEMSRNDVDSPRFRR